MDDWEDSELGVRVDGCVVATWMDGWMYGLQHVWMDCNIGLQHGWMDGWMDCNMDGWITTWIATWIYTCVSASTMHTYTHSVSAYQTQSRKHVHASACVHMHMDGIVFTDARFVSLSQYIYTYTSTLRYDI